MVIQNVLELEKWFDKTDPWKYENSKDDKLRKKILLDEIPPTIYTRVLDVGCGHGYITRDLPGKEIIGVDISKNAILQAQNFGSDRIKFEVASLFDINKKFQHKFNLIVITGVLYPQYIGNSNNLIYKIIDDVLEDSGILISVHINDWYKSRFPFLKIKDVFYKYKNFTHRLEVYIK